MDLTELHRSAERLARDPRFASAIRGHLDDAGHAGAPLELAIHPADQMLNHSLGHHRDAGAALSQYFAISLQQLHAARAILGAAFPGDAREAVVLDFACGYGRLLRFLAASHPRERLYASELQRDAVEFVADTFGIAAIPSSEAPARFDPGRRFDFIWVASLFSHLPEVLFHGWLARLLELLTPRGTLCFSVRDAALLSGETMPASGFLYRRESENAELDASIYGTTHASEAFVRRALVEAGGGELPCVRIPRALAQEQDLYVVAKSTGTSLAGLAGFRRGPWGWVDRRVRSDGALELEGWAASLDDGAIDHVDIEVDGEQHRVRTSIARPDVADTLADSRMARAGWRVTVPVRTAAPFVCVSARSARGERGLLYAGTVPA